MRFPSASATPTSFLVSVGRPQTQPQYTFPAFSASTQSPLRRKPPLVVHGPFQILHPRPGMPGRGVQVCVPGQYRHPVQALSRIYQHLAEGVMQSVWGDLDAGQPAEFFISTRCSRSG